MTDILAQVCAYLERDLPELVAIRQDIHAHPELGMEERRTSAVVEGKLREWGIEEVERIATTGVVARIVGRRPGGQIGLRADMDALAITEKTGLPYASRFAGRMHACGHDGHTTMLLGAARYLARNPDFAGTVNCVFQPAEEGRGGARAVLGDGLFTRFPCSAIYGLHAMPGLPVGHFATRTGAFFAAACPWRITFRGTGGHGGAAPHQTNDVMVVLGSFLQSLHSIVSRNIAATEVAVISVGYTYGGSSESPSVIPPDVVVGGTARCFNEATASIVAGRLEQLAIACAQAHNCFADVEIVWRAPPLINHAREVDVAIAAATDVVGRDAVDGEAEQLTAGEDFAEILKVCPGAFVLLGNGDAHSEHPSGLHTPLFNFNDELIPVGIAYWVALVNRELGNGT